MKKYPFPNLFKNILLVCVLIFMLNACASNDIQLQNFKKDDYTKVYIPKICKKQYTIKTPSVAVVNFTNNSNFGTAKVKNSVSHTKARINTLGLRSTRRYNHHLSASLGVSTSKVRAITNTQGNTRVVKTKLSQSVVSLLENLLNQIGGLRLYSRSDFDKISNELKLQDSGLLDEGTLTKFGKLSGVDYLVTGSIDYVKQDYTDLGTLANGVRRTGYDSGQSNIALGGDILALGSYFTDGMSITPKITIKVLDVASGKILFIQSIENSVKIGHIKNPSYSQVIGAIKTAIDKSLPLFKSKLSKYFFVQGYVTTIKSNDDAIITRINLGTKDGLVKGQALNIYSFDYGTNPLTNKKYCNILKTDSKLIVTNQISEHFAWARVDGDFKPKLLEIVRKN